MSSNARYVHIGNDNRPMFTASQGKEDAEEIFSGFLVSTICRLGLNKLAGSLFQRDLNIGERLTQFVPTFLSHVC